MTEEAQSDYAAVKAIRKMLDGIVIHAQRLAGMIGEREAAQALVLELARVPSLARNAAKYRDPVYHAADSNWFRTIREVNNCVAGILTILPRLEGPLESVLDLLDDGGKLGRAMSASAIIALAENYIFIAEENGEAVPTAEYLEGWLGRVWRLVAEGAAVSDALERKRRRYARANTSKAAKPRTSTPKHHTVVALVRKPLQENAELPPEGGMQNCISIKDHANEAVLGRNGASEKETGADA